MKQMAKWRNIDLSLSGVKDLEKIQGTIVLLAGKSGTGKSTVADRYCKITGCSQIPSYTTRPMRACETNGIGHIFITDQEFDRITDIAAYTEFDGYRYCATQTQIDEAGIYVVDLNGIMDVKRFYRGKKEIFVVYLKIPEDLRINRMKERGDSDEMIRNRLKNDAVMFDGIEMCSDLILDAGSDPDQICKKILEAIS